MPANPPTPQAGKFPGWSRVGMFGKRECKGNLAASSLRESWAVITVAEFSELEVEQPGSRPSAPSSKW